jgi:hypothetical protein
MQRANHSSTTHDSIRQQSPFVGAKCLSREQPPVASAKDRYFEISNLKSLPFPKWNLRSWAERVKHFFLRSFRQNHASDEDRPRARPRTKAEDDDESFS